jgi:hypothetical protein
MLLLKESENASSHAIAKNPNSTVVRRLEKVRVTIDKLSDTLANIGSYIHGHTSFAGVRSGGGEEKPFLRAGLSVRPIRVRVLCLVELEFCAPCLLVIT